MSRMEMGRLVDIIHKVMIGIIVLSFTLFVIVVTTHNAYPWLYMFTMVTFGLGVVSLCALLVAMSLEGYIKRVKTNEKQVKIENMKEKVWKYLGIVERIFDNFGIKLLYVGLITSSIGVLMFIAPMLTEFVLQIGNFRGWFNVGIPTIGSAYEFARLSVVGFSIVISMLSMLMLAVTSLIPANPFKSVEAAKVSE